MTEQIKKHWIKSVSWVALLILGSFLWHHKKEDIAPPPSPSFINTTLAPEPVLITPPPPPAITSLPPTASTTLASSSKPAPAIALTQLIPKPVLQKPSPTYTLQLIASHKRTALQNFVRENHLERNTHIIETQFQGRAWYIVAYGSFHHYPEAHLALQQLPPTLQKFHPWIKKF